MKSGIRLIRKKSKLNSPIMGIVMLIPAFLFFLAFQFYPFFSGVVMSFTDRYLMTKNAPQFIGLQNYIQILTDDTTFWPALKFSFIYTFSIVIVSYIVGMIIALLLNTDIKARGLFRAFILVPWVISSAVMSTNWKWLLNDRYGLINKLLQALHIVDDPILFFSTPVLAKFTVTLVGIWRNIPFMSIVLLSGLQNIPIELYEAADVDGANALQKFFMITIPQLRGVTLSSTTLMFIWALNGFENIYLLTNGGPLKSTTGVAIYSYLQAFDSSKMGYAAALSVLLMLIMIVFSAIRFKFSKDQE